VHVLKRAKRGLLDVCSGLGFSEQLLASRWRTERLLILCYHGIAMSDEDEWDPALYMQSSLLKARFQQLRDRSCNVLPLGEGIWRLFAGSLPPRAVAITFDDGAFDFYAVAWPIIREFGYPVTVYVPTYYVEFNRPVFDPMSSYLIWKALGKRKSFPPVWREDNLLDASGSAQACTELGEFSRRGKLSGREKDDLLCSLAAALDIDYNDLCSRRVLHLMNSTELAEVAHAGVDIQLHTHRHRVSTRRERFMQEIDDNRRSIENLTQRPARHFCYPGGFQIPRFQEWLPECQVESATTCVPGIAASSCSPFLLPRLVDTCGLSMQEFDAWICGIAAFLPGRPHVMSEGQVFDEEPYP
jgi:peptidoglycan/xylan/chitin deacetylase (PgdA/CDA1 family)